jgi:GTP1/Obg family GTP-binding protein
LTINFDIDRENHLATASKDRTWLFEWRDFFLLTSDIWEEIKKWNLSWEKVKNKEEISQELFNEYFEKLKNSDNLDKLKETFLDLNWNKTKFIEQHLKELTDLKDQIKNNLTINN